jgi:hypothetical protein
MGRPEEPGGFIATLVEKAMIGPGRHTPHQLKHLQRDIAFLRKRIHSEGISFVTKTLPKLGKALDMALVSRRLEVPKEFKSLGNQNRPEFLQANFSRCFDSCGVLLEGAPPEDIQYLRQVLFCAYRLELPHTQSQNQSVIDGFIETERELEAAALETPNPKTLRVLEEAALRTAVIFRGFDPRDIYPRHGPGAVATGERHEDKWVFSRLYDDIHQVFPYYEYFVVGGARELADRRDWYLGLDRIISGQAKVVLVPKDSRGPRLISCEPLEYQWIQQGLGRKFMDHLESCWITKGYINFRNQEVNRGLALTGSDTREWATIDLKDASDRVSLELVRRVFAKVPDILRALEACRTTATKLPDGSVLPLKKFAPMGSALCFPVESFCFWSVIVATVTLRTRLPRRYVEQRVFVYGDDIVVPTSWAPVVISALEGVGLKVNLQKCCTAGDFRESCGMDAFKGVDVTPVKVRKLWTGRHTDANAYVAYAEYANHFSRKGYHDVASFIRGELSRVYGILPYGSPKASYPCIEVPSAWQALVMNDKLPLKSRWNRSLQRLEFRVNRIRPVRRPSKLEGWSRLTRNMMQGVGDEPSVYVVPRTTKIQLGWAGVS